MDIIAQLLTSKDSILMKSGKIVVSVSAMLRRSEDIVNMWWSPVSYLCVRSHAVEKINLPRQATLFDAASWFRLSLRARGALTHKYIEEHRQPNKGLASQKADSDEKYY